MSEVLPESNEQYGTKEYWFVHLPNCCICWGSRPLIFRDPDRDQRYSRESEDATFDWFKSYSDIAPIVRELIPNKDARILMLGCGNSKLSEEMYDDGYKKISNVDYSGILIDKMRNKYGANRPEMQWQEMDVRKLKFNDGEFDVAIDKGTMDAMMTAKGDVWNPPDEVVENCTKEVDEVVRVLQKPGGVFIYLTFGQPHFRRRFLTRNDTTLEIREIGDAFHYYFYIVRT